MIVFTENAHGFYDVIVPDLFTTSFRPGNVSKEWAGLVAGVTKQALQDDSVANIRTTAKLLGDYGRKTFLPYARGNRYVVQRYGIPAGYGIRSDRRRVYADQAMGVVFCSERAPRQPAAWAVYALWRQSSRKSERADLRAGPADPDLRAGPIDTDLPRRWWRRFRAPRSPYPPCLWQGRPACPPL